MTDQYADLHSGATHSTVYYWLNPDTGAALYHTGVNDEAAIPFFKGVGAAERYMEQRATDVEKESFERYSLYETKTRKVGTPSTC